MNKSRNMKSQRLGEQFTNKWGTWTIIEYKNHKNIVCERDDGFILNTSYSKFKLKNLKGKNRYDLSNDYGICYSMNTNDKILFDLEDYDKIKDYTWSVKSDGNYKKVTSHANHKYTVMQHLITGQKHLDHINNNPLDNRKCNLRYSIDSDGYDKNGMNKSLNKLNTSGHKGVSFDKKNNKWIAQICYKYKHYTKRFTNFEDACEWVDNKRAELHGDYANFG